MPVGNVSFSFPRKLYSRVYSLAFDRTIDIDFINMYMNSTLQLTSSEYRSKPLG
jgi:hypothetical protein